MAPSTLHPAASRQRAATPASAPVTPWNWATRSRCCRFMPATAAAPAPLRLYCRRAVLRYAALPAPLLLLEAREALPAATQTCTQGGGGWISGGFRRAAGLPLDRGPWQRGSAPGTHAHTRPAPHVEALGTQALLVRLDQRLAARGLRAVGGGALVASTLRAVKGQATSARGWMNTVHKITQGAPCAGRTSRGLPTIQGLNAQRSAKDLAPGWTCLGFRAGAADLLLGLLRLGLQGDAMRGLAQRYDRYLPSLSANMPTTPGPLPASQSSCGAPS